MNRTAIASELVKLARGLTAEVAATPDMLRDLKAMEILLKGLSSNLGVMQDTARRTGKLYDLDAKNMLEQASELAAAAEGFLHGKVKSK